MRFVTVSIEDVHFLVDGARAADIDPTDRIGEPMARQGGKIMTCRHRANRRRSYGVRRGDAIGESAPTRLGLNFRSRPLTDGRGGGRYDPS
jgi:hypothetical protein